MAVPKLVVLQGRFGAVITDEGEHLSLLSAVSLLNPELGQGPGVNAGLRESHGMIKVSKGQGWRTEPRGQRKDHHDSVNPYSIPPAPLSSAACIPKPQPGVLLPPASPPPSGPPLHPSLQGPGCVQLPREGPYPRSPCR